MGMSSSVAGFRAPDEKWEQMKSVYEACKRAGVVIPGEVQKFFNEEEPDPAGIHVDLRGILTAYKDGGCEGYELRVVDIPENVTVLRFKNCW